MQVIVRLEGHLREFFPALVQPRTVSLAAPVTIAEIIAAVGMDPSLPSSVLCNKLRVERDHIPADGDELILLSPLAGG